MDQSEETISNMSKAEKERMHIIAVSFQNFPEDPN